LRRRRPALRRPVGRDLPQRRLAARPEPRSGDATEFAYGVGARWRIQNFGVQLEYEKFDTDVVGDLDLLSLGVTYTFDMM
jgi:hypothetical protein